MQLSTILIVLLYGMAHVPNTLSTKTETKIDLRAFLEGPYDQDKGQMSTYLYDMGYLPGMKPNAFLGKATANEDPYEELIEGQSLSSRFSAHQYQAGSVDWIHVIIKKQISDRAVHQSTAMLYADGHMELLTYPKLSQGDSYKIILIHRNHLPIESSYVVMDNSGALSYDFSDGEQMGGKVIDGVTVLYAGSLDRQETNQINKTDLKVWSQDNGQHSTYLQADLNFDGDVTVADQAILLRNINRISPVIVGK